MSNLEKWIKLFELYDSNELQKEEQELLKAKITGNPKVYNDYKLYKEVEKFLQKLAGCYKK